MVVLNLFRGMNLWYNFTFLKLERSMFVWLMDCHMFLDMQSKLKLDYIMDCTNIIDGNGIWLVIYELVFSTYCTLCEISTFLDG
jgi:hypothetical protein